MGETEFQREVLSRLDGLLKEVNSLSTRTQLHEQRTDTDRERLLSVERRVDAERDRTDLRLSEVKKSASEGRRVIETRVDELEAQNHQLRGALVVMRWVAGGGAVTGAAATTAQLLQALGVY